MPMNIKSEMLLKLKNQKSCHELEKINFKKQEAAKWFVHLRDEICRSFEEIENTSSNNEKTSFDQKQWKRDWNKNNNPEIALKAFLKKNKDFKIDKKNSPGKK